MVPDLLVKWGVKRQLCDCIIHLKVPLVFAYEMYLADMLGTTFDRQVSDGSSIFVTSSYSITNSLVRSNPVFCYIWCIISTYSSIVFIPKNLSFASIFSFNVSNAFLLLFIQINTKTITSNNERLCPHTYIARGRKKMLFVTLC